MNRMWPETIEREKTVDERGARNGDNHWTYTYLYDLYYPAQRFNNCAALVCDVLALQCDVEINLDDERWWAHGMGKFPDELVKEGQDVAEKVEVPEEYDICLMRIRGNKRVLGSHIGIVSLIGEAVWVLHSMKNIGTVFCPISRLGHFHLELAGYYRPYFKFGKVEYRGGEGF